MPYTNCAIFHVHLSLFKTNYVQQQTMIKTVLQIVKLAFSLSVAKTYLWIYVHMAESMTCALR